MHIIKVPLSTQGYKKVPPNFIIPGNPVMELKGLIDLPSCAGILGDHVSLPWGAVWVQGNPLKTPV